jgi:hypothetical protein
VFVNQLFEFFAGLKIWNAFGGDTDRISGLGVSTATGASLAHAKATEAA